MWAPPLEAAWPGQAAACLWETCSPPPTAAGGTIRVTWFLQGWARAPHVHLFLPPPTVINTIIVLYR